MSTFFDLFFEFHYFPSLLIATLPFIIYCPKRRYFLLRIISLAIVASVIASFQWKFAKSDMVMNALSYFGPILCSILFFAEIAAICIACFKCGYKELCIYLIGGWTTQHLSGMLSSITARLFAVEVNYVHYNWQYFVITNVSYILVYCAVWLLFGRIRRNSSIIRSNRILIPSTVMLCVMIVLNVIMPYDLSDRGFYVMRCYSVACCLVMLFLIFSAFKEGSLNYELDVLSQLEKKNSEQFQISKESIEVINTKCHDLKKLLEIIKNDGSKAAKEEIAMISDDVARYEALVKTGNKAFDTILTEKSLFCEKNKVQLSVIADFKTLGKMSEIDIYSLFGNIMDNAIEAVMKLEEYKRIITLAVREINGMISVHAENCFYGELQCRNGLPVTNKSDKNNHGFGILSIKRTVEKYGGEVSFSASDGLFGLDVLFPA